MEQTVLRLIEIDQAANQMIEKAMKEKQAIMSRIDTDQLALQRKYEQLTNEKAALYEQSKTAEIQQQIEKIKASQKKQSQALKQKFLDHRSKWAAEIAKRALGEESL